MGGELLVEGLEGDAGGVVGVGGVSGELEAREVEEVLRLLLEHIPGAALGDRGLGLVGRGVDLAEDGELEGGGEGGAARELLLVERRGEGVLPVGERGGEVAQLEQHLSGGVTRELAPDMERTLEGLALSVVEPAYSMISSSEAARPKVSGAYISSARVGGTRKRPSVVARAV